MWVAGGVLLVAVALSVMGRDRPPSGVTVDVGWDLAHVGIGDSVLVIRAGHNACDDRRAATADESATEVVVTVSAYRESRPGESCPAAVDYDYYLIELGAGLGDRDLVGCRRDSPCDELLRVE